MSNLAAISTPLDINANNTPNPPPKQNKTKQNKTKQNREKMMSRLLVCLVVLMQQVMLWHCHHLHPAVGDRGDEEANTNTNANTNTDTPVIFNFGDSNSDTGGRLAGLGIPVNPPNGRVYFRRSTGRLSDGRLVLDFLCQSLNTSLLSAYLEALGSDFQNGANFAVSGSTTRPRDVRFALNVQIVQFLHFKARSLQLAATATATGSKGLINEEGFRNALYMIDIGQNDLAYPFTQNQSYSQVVPRIPLVIAEIKHAVKTLYDEGGRKFWIHNTGPLGCLPEHLWLAQPKKEDLDTSGCISIQNSVAKLFNEALLQLCQDIKSEMMDATIVYVDIYSIKYDLITNATTYGFSRPLMACCGAGGLPYNFDRRMLCGDPGSQACTDGSRCINWDGTHYTEAANAIIAKRILSTHYSIPRISFNFFFQNHRIVEKDTDSMSVSEI